MSTKIASTRVRLSPEERAAEILSAAKQIARADGLGALAVRPIAAVAQVTPGLVTHYFSLDELISKAYTALAADEYGAMIKAFESLPGPIEKLDAVLESSLSEEYAAVNFMWVESWAIARRNPHLKSALREQAAVWHQLISDIVEEGVRHGEFHVDDAQATAWQLLALIDGTSAHASMRDIDDPLTASTLRRSAAAILGRVDRSMQRSTDVAQT
ncbi:TetR/AcrR family transcriptional regulator [Microbacterium aurantiacum]|uniref:TetR/AcrR family transcriptional regulator n=1 Tax=Microbacterium aurantiacum TaxID=162393 RepID=UPI000C804A76|nr:TetR family transcriptional regulator C-terminal domain-containing protein [Microbacterium aurantiacum]